jgi:hypothetical protein
MSQQRTPVPIAEKRYLKIAARLNAWMKTADMKKQ